jgi:hypothetical protein
MSRETILRVIRETPEIGFQITKLIGLRLRTFRSRIDRLRRISIPSPCGRVESHGPPRPE